MAKTFEPSQDAIDQIAKIDASFADLIDLKAVLPLEQEFDPDVFQAIGTLMAIAAHTDFTLTHHMLRLISGDRKTVVYQASPLVAGADFKVKVRFYRVFVSMYFDDTDTDFLFNKILDRLESAYQRRNELAHGSLTARPSKSEIEVQSWRMKPRLRGFPPPQVVKLRQIREWTWQLYIWTKQLTGMLDQIGFPRGEPKKARKAASRKRPAPRRSGRPNARKRRTR